MGLRSLLFSFEGRINRLTYWYVFFASLCSYLVFFVFMVVLAFALSFIFGVTSVDVHVFPLFSFHASFKDVSPASNATLIYPLFYAAETPMFVVGMWFLAAPTIKRLHDRNKSGWWIVPFFIVPFFVAPNVHHKLWDWLDIPPILAFIVIAFGLGLWGFVELLCLRGTRGPNRFGPDPLASVATGALIDWRPDQRGVPGFLVHNGGPHAGRNGQ